MNIALLCCGKLEDDVACLNELDAYDLTGVRLSRHHLPYYLHTSLVSNNANGCNRAPRYYT